jgi:hypothetical protein
VKIALYVIWALFVMGAAFSCTKAVRTTKRQEQLITTWSKTQAVVTGSRQGWSDGPGNATRSIRYWPRYQFHDSRGVLYVGESDVSYRGKPVPRSPLEVAYNPEDPNQSLQVTARSNKVLGCLIPAFALLSLAAFWFIGVFPVG